MIAIEPLTPEDYVRIPWKNGRGALVVIDREGAETWANMGVAWHFGRTSIVEEGPFSDYSGYERLQVAIKGTGLVLVASDHEIDLRQPLSVQRYDGGLPVRTRLENGPVEVVNLIANRALFDIDLRVARAGDTVDCGKGRHVVYAPTGSARVTLDGRDFELREDHALRVRADDRTRLQILDGTALVGLIVPRA